MFRQKTALFQLVYIPQAVIDSLSLSLSLSFFLFRSFFFLPPVVSFSCSLLPALSPSLPPLSLSLSLSLFHSLVFSVRPVLQGERERERENDKWRRQEKESM
ncbi:hypothetical protein AALO_G00130650 [Alosa alosa]|uniref:Transmembrane protein n=1 Tax=Alosa alosa TaxID=278164 RepID=A0AAV6GRP6_9TELE|nr:hypothetical protein AALO_G00130650 [Alosa alosa]